MATTQTKTKGKETPAAVKANPGKVEKAPKKEVKKEVGTLIPIVSVKSSALSTDVGPLVIAGLARTFTEEEKANEALRDIGQKRYELLSMTTLAIVKAAKADDTIDLSAAFSADKKKQAKLNDQIGLALGFREVETYGPKDDPKERIRVAKAVAKFFPASGDTKGSLETVRKTTLRSNFLHLIKKCQQAAAAIIEKDLTVKKDDKSGTLMVGGPAIKAEYGVDTVLLDEKQTIRSDNPAQPDVKLKKKPSFTGLAVLGADAHGGAVVKGSGEHRSATVTSPVKALKTLSDNVIKVLEKYNPKDEETAEKELRPIFNALRNAFEEHLGDEE